jgi:hypothetical protein
LGWWTSLVLCAQSAPARSQVRVGPEFQVNSTTTMTQFSPYVASDAAGNFVVVWTAQDSDQYGIFGQRYDASGVPRGGEFQVNSYTANTQTAMSVASDAGGNFVVVWASQGQDGSDYGIFGQRFDALGVAQGVEFQVNSYTTGSQFALDVAQSANGFVVVWASLGQDGSSNGIFGQRFDASGARQGAEFQVNSYTTGRQFRPAVASDAGGNFVVAWDSDGPDDEVGVFGQRFAASGSRLGGEFQVNSHTTGYQGGPDVTVGATGDFLVVWTGAGQGGDAPEIFGQRYDASATRLGDEFQVNSYTTERQSFASVATSSNGDFLVVWGSDTQDGSLDGIFGQRYNTSGARLGGEFQVNSYTTDQQFVATVAAIANAQFVVTWHSDGQDGSRYGVFGQRFAPDLIFADGFE